MATTYEQRPRILFATLRQRTSKAGRTYFVGYQGDLVLVGFQGRKEINGQQEDVIEVYVESSPREQRSHSRAAREQGAERAGAPPSARPSSVENEAGATRGNGSARRKGESSRKLEAAREVINRYGGPNTELDDEIPF